MSENPLVDRALRSVACKCRRGPVWYTKRVGRNPHLQSHRAPSLYWAVPDQRATGHVVGSMRDTSPWDHLDYAGKRLSPVKGTIEIDVNEVANTGQVVAEFVENTDRFRIIFDRFSGKSPYQDGGITTRIYEHGDSGNGDPLYPKAWLYLAGWGTATMWKNDQALYKDYDAHFMVMERSRDP